MLEEAKMSHPNDLRHLSLFKGCSEEDLEVAARLLTPVNASPGRRLMTQGDTARQFVIIESGSVHVTHHVEGGPDLEVTLGPDTFVGEVGLLDGVPCTATVVTTDEGARVHVANPAEFRQLLDLLPVACSLRATADDRLAQNELVDAV
jgi:CRP-like cAMP-binding protein